jgi:tRNA (adenine37-N6)-methyltransferase
MVPDPGISYQPIGFVISPITQLVRPEIIRSAKAELVLEERFAPAVEALEAGQHLIVIFHLHRAEDWQEQLTPELFTRRMPRRPNPIGVTVVRIVALQDSTITVAGLDAVDGTPILDIKPYKPIFDSPPVTASELNTTSFRDRIKIAWRILTEKVTTTQPRTVTEPTLRGRPIIVLTGGPGGGKSTLIEDLRNDPDWASKFVCLPEAVQYARFSNIDPAEKIFQRMVVHLQIGLENGLDRACGPGDSRLILCHRGSLDPLAFWRLRGWPVEEFFSFTGMSLHEHYRRYAAIIHLVTAAEGTPRLYTRWPTSHRPEDADTAILLDRWLTETWENHPEYYRIDNTDRDWPAKSKEAIKILDEVLK